MTVVRFLPAIVAAASAAALPGAVHAAVPATTVPWVLTARPEPPALSGPFRPRPASTISYTIINYGAPNPTSLLLGTPVALNDTRQIVGLATFPVGGNQQCVAWTGKKFIDFGGPKSLPCYPSTGISNANKAGVFASVGETYVPTDEDSIAFYATVSPTAATVKFYSSNVNSALYAMNASGYAAGFSYYAPVGGFETSRPPFVSSGADFGPLQPTCISASTACLYQPYYTQSFYAETRPVNVSGTVFGQESILVTGDYVEVNTTHPSLSHSFQLPFQGPNAPGQIIGIDDVGRVYYVSENATNTNQLIYRFDPRTNTGGSIGNIPGDVCSFNLYSLNGNGELLAYANNCKKSQDDGWVTWDPKHGFSLLTLGIPGNSYSSITPEWINDKGDVLVELRTNTGALDWGILAQK